MHEARAARLRLAIVTTASADGVEAFFEREPDLFGGFELVAAGDVVAKKKPAPDIYEWALEKLKLAPRECIAIEDSNVGLSASRAAGIPTLVTLSTYTAGEDFSGAAAVVTDLGEPGAAARVLHGDPLPRGYVDIAYLARLVR